MINGSSGLAILSGGMGGGNAPSMSAITAFRQYQRDQVGERTKFMNREDIQRDINYFKKQAGKTEDLDALIKNPRMLQFIATAFGLESEATQPGKMKAILKSDPNDVNSFANRLRDPRFGEMAKHFNIANEDMLNLGRASKQETLVQKYLTNTFEQDLAAKNPAVRDAVFFLRRINDVNSSYDILGDMTMRTIVNDALAIPAQTANQSLSTQVDLIDRKLKLDKLKITSGTDAKLTLPEVLNADIAELTDAIAKISAAASQTSSLLTTLKNSRNDLDNIADRTDPGGINKSEITVQKAAMPDIATQFGLSTAAAKAMTAANAHLATLDSLITQARSVADTDDLDALKTAFQTTAESLKDRINTANYGASNLLLDGAADITTVLAVDGTSAITQFTDLKSFLTTIDTAANSFDAVNFSTLEADLDGVASNLDAGDADFAAAESLMERNVVSIRFAANQVTFATELDTQSLAMGVEAIADAKQRSATIRNILGNISALASEAQSADAAGLSEINTAYSTALSDLKTAITEPGSLTDGTTTYTFDNLLRGSGRSYTVIAGKASLTAESSRLQTTINFAMTNAYGSITAANASSLFNDIADTYLTTLDATDHHLERDGAVIDFIAKEVDPQGQIDHTIIGQKDALDQMINDSASGSRSFLSPYASDLRVNFQSSITPEIISSASNFKADIETSVDGYRHAVLSGASTADRKIALNDVFFRAGSTDSKLSSATQQLTLRSSIFASERDELTASGSDNAFLKPLENSAYAVKFMEQYLIRKEIQANSGGLGSTDIKASLVGLIQPIGGNINLFS
jgi:hypothetical protein